MKLNATDLVAGNTYTISAQAKDGEGTLEYKFTAIDENSKEAIEISDYTTASTVKWTPVKGTYKIQVTVKDAKGNTDTKEITSVVVSGRGRRGRYSFIICRCSR